jgi:hypothetical protein
MSSHHGEIIETHIFRDFFSLNVQQISDQVILNRGHPFHTVISWHCIVGRKSIGANTSVVSSPRERAGVSGLRTSPLIEGSELENA